MNATGKFLVAALAVSGLAVAADAQAQARGSHGPGYNGGGNHGGGVYRGGGGYRGGSWGHGGGRYYGGYRGGYWGPRFGLYIGAPLLLGGLGWPYYYPEYYPSRTVVYREVERYPTYVEQQGEIVPSTEVQRMEGAPSQGPLYMNYCESAKAYFPKVTTCPEGWKLATPTQ